MTDTQMLRMQVLIQELNEASTAYYGGGKELMSDHEWDAKFDELTKLENETNTVLKNSPTHKVSDEGVQGDVLVVKHEFPALSLQKSKSVDALIKWADGRPVNLSWKLDGMTLVVTYDGGKLVRIVTRHDGITGYDITKFADAIRNIPKTINYSGHLVVRGEALISYDDFEKVNEMYDGVYENPRNLVAGSLNPSTKSASDIEDRCITWVPFTLVYIDSNDEKVNKNWSSRMAYLRALGFETVDSEIIMRPNVYLKDVVEKWSNNVSKCKYAVDGLVLVYEDVEYASQGTDTGHHNTRGGFAFKWQDTEAESVLTYIDWSPSVNSINPVAVFESVRLEGTTVSRASLCNLSELERLGIGGPGTKVTVIKANKIIPKVVRAEVPEGVSKNWDIPEVCPVCGSKTEVFVSDKGVKTLVCTNKDCAAKNLRKLERFVCKYGFNIIGLSVSTLKKMIELKLISNFEDVLSIPEREIEIRNALENQPGFGSKMVTNMMVSVHKARYVDADKFLYSLCIPMCGRDMAKKLASKYTICELIDKAISDAKNGTSVICEECDGIGEVKAKAFVDWFADDTNVEMVNRLVSLCTITNAVKSFSVFRFKKCRLSHQ